MVNVERRLCCVVLLCHVVSGKSAPSPDVYVVYSYVVYLYVVYLYVVYLYDIDVCVHISDPHTCDCTYVYASVSTSSFVCYDTVWL